jgi:hypothetical protein
LVAWFLIFVDNKQRVTSDRREDCLMNDDDDDDDDDGDGDDHLAISTTYVP